MSEIKGQMLGLVLVLAIFGLIGTSIYAAFKTSSTNLASEMSNESTLIAKD